MRMRPRRAAPGPCGRSTGPYGVEASGAGRKRRAPSEAEPDAGAKRAAFNAFSSP